MEQPQSLAADASADTTEKSNGDPQAAAEASTNKSSAPATSDDAPAKAVTVTVCGVCEKNVSKYKCPRCYLPYCSVACNKIHKENHPPDLEPKPATKPELPEKPINGTVAILSDPSNPFRALDKSDQLQRLFRKYPRLPQQLLDIFAATEPPEEAPEKKIPASMMQGVNKKDSWNHDIGIKRGKEALRRARRADGEAGDAIREYSELILHLINTQDDKGQVSAMLQQQAVQEDARLIEQLMAQERR